MFNVAADSVSPKPYVENELAQLRSGQQRAAEHLIVAHCDADVVRRLSAALGPDDVLLQIPQTEWSFHGGSLPEVIIGTLRAGNPKQLVLVGHSRAAVGATQPGFGHGGSHPAGARSDMHDNGYEGILSRVGLHQQQRQNAKQQFVAQLRQLAQTPEVQQRIDAGTLGLDGLYYLAESGTFLAYDMSSGLFHSLVHPGSAA